jgi:hypothetical protein
MPTYEFKNTKTGEVFEKFMSYDNKVKFLEENPDVKSHYTTLNIDHDGGKSILSRAGSGWKEVQDRIKSGMPPRLRDNIKSK